MAEFLLCQLPIRKSSWMAVSTWFNKQPEYVNDKFLQNITRINCKLIQIHNLSSNEIINAQIHLLYLCFTYFNSLLVRQFTKITYLCEFSVGDESAASYMFRILHQPVIFNWDSEFFNGIMSRILKWLDVNKIFINGFPSWRFLFSFRKWNTRKLRRAAKRPRRLTYWETIPQATTMTFSSTDRQGANQLQIKVHYRARRFNCFSWRVILTFRNCNGSLHYGK